MALPSGTPPLDTWRLADSASAATGRSFLQKHGQGPRSQLGGNRNSRASPGHVCAPRCKNCCCETLHLRQVGLITIKTMSAVPHESLTNHGWLLTSNEILPGDLALTIWIEALDPCLGQHRKPDEGPRDNEETVHHDLSAVQVTRSTDPSFLVRNFFTMALAMIEAFLPKRMCAIWLDEKRSLAKAREPTLPRLVAEVVWDLQLFRHIALRWSGCRRVAPLFRADNGSGVYSCSQMHSRKQVNSSLYCTSEQARADHTPRCPVTLFSDEFATAAAATDRYSPQLPV